MTRRRIAVIGSGVAGLTAAHILQRAADVTLFEADDRLGGHAHTHDIDDGSSTLAVDTGFIVHNERTYPVLLRLFAELGVATRASDMSMSVRCDGCGLEYAGGAGIGGLFPSPRRIADPRHLRMLFDITRFYRRAQALLQTPDDGGLVTLREFLDAGRFGRHVRTHFVTPVVSAVWSTAPDLALEYPARYLFTFLQNHGALSVNGSPTWRTVVGGSRTYVERAAKGLNAVQTSTPVRALARAENGVTVRTDADSRLFFDAAVVATHPRQALRLLAAPTDDERRLLGAIEYSPNPTVLHTDAATLPHAERARASWNYYLPTCHATPDRVHVTYDMNRLQGLDSPVAHLVTLNDPGTIRADAILDRMDYEHPTFTAASVAAQRELPTLNDARIAFAGAYHGWGFHEDGARSGVQAAESLGVTW